MNKPEHPAEASALAHEAGVADRPDHVEHMPETPAEEPVADSGRGAQKKDSWLEVVKTIVYALIIAGVIRSFLFQPFNIPSGSMEDTLLIGDYLFVSKATYGYSRYSFPFGIIPFQGRFAVMSEPQRGDIVVFKFPPDNSTDYIKRLIGLPGDRVQMKDGVLYINDVAVPKEKIDDYVETVGGESRNIPRYRETLPNGVSYEVLDRDPQGNLDNTQVFVVPEGHYFMMGDNRDNSADSRVDVGYVPFENFVGKAQIIFFSTNGEARIWEIWKWPFAIRYDRLGRFVQ
jgi:signal peptidase I